MSARNIAIVVLSVWGLPLVMVAIAFLFMPDPNQPKSAHPSVTFIPQKIETREKSGRKGSTSFEVWLHHPDGSAYLHRDPESAPITALFERIPKGVALQITYTTTPDGNVLLGIDRTDSTDMPILSYDAVMAEYAARRRLVLTIAGVWLVLGTLLAFVLHRAGMLRR